MTPLPTLPVRGPACPPAVELERACAGESVPSVAAHVPTCSACREYVEALRSLTDDFVRARPAARFLSQLEAKRRMTSRRPQALVLGALAALVAVLVVAAPWRTDEPVLLKGSLLSIYVKRGAAVTPLGTGDVLREGDALRFSMTTSRAGHALVLNRDPRGQVTVVAPFNAAAPQPVPEGTTVLEDSAELDATKGRETFVGLFAPTAFDVSRVVRQLEAGEPVTCKGCVVEVSTFDKP